LIASESNNTKAMAGVEGENTLCRFCRLLIDEMERMEERKEEKN
jgi:hypothetical protein